jgi:hypothetical protein
MIPAGTITLLILMVFIVWVLTDIPGLFALPTGGT